MPENTPLYPDGPTLDEVRQAERILRHIQGFFFNRASLIQGASILELAQLTHDDIEGLIEGDN